MPDPSFDTARLHAWVDRWRGGDRDAADKLLRSVQGRLEYIARKMLGGFANVRRWTDTNDVLQNALIRLLRSLEQVRPESVRSFFNLAAVHIRRELIDLARRQRGAHHPGAHHTSQVPDDIADAGESPADLEPWVRFHEQVEKLPDEEREVFGLAFYHGWEQLQIAVVLGVSDRTVRRRWQSACVRLHDALGGELPMLRD